MVFVPFTDIQTVAILIFLVLIFDVLAFVFNKSILLLGGGIFAAYGASVVGQTNYVITSKVYDPSIPGFIYDKTDPSIFLLMFGLLAILSFAIFAKETKLH